MLDKVLLCFNQDEKCRDMRKLFVAFIFLCVWCCNAEWSGATPVGKEVAKRAKQYKKDGWKVFSDGQSLESQLEAAFVKELELGLDGEPKYMSVTVMADGPDLETARMKTRELAKLKFASSIGESVQAMITLKLENQQVGQNEMRSSNELVSIAKSRAVQKLGRIQPVLECWRECSDKSMEVCMIIMYDISEVVRLADAVMESAYE